MKRIYFKSEFVDWYELSTPKNKEELRRYIKREDTEHVYGGKDTGVILYMRDGTFKQASYVTVERLLDDAIAWARCDIFKKAKSALDKWKDEHDPLFKLTQAANIYKVDLEKNSLPVYDWFHEAHVYSPLDDEPIPPIRGLTINPADFTEETADDLYSLWIDFEAGLVYFICSKDSAMDRMVRDRIPAAENLNLTKELRELYNSDKGFRSCCD